jgi:hypothetical protein
MIDFIIKYDAEIIAFLIFGAAILLYFVFVGRIGRRSATNERTARGSRAFTTGLKTEETDNEE